MISQTIEKEKVDSSVSPERLIQLGLGFFVSKVLLSALKFDLFTVLDNAPLTASDIQSQLALHPRGVLDFLDTLVSVGILIRKDGKYSNSPETRVFLNRRSPSYIGYMLEMANDRLYEFWGRLEVALKTGKPQNETRDGKDFFDALYSDPQRRELFLKSMIGLSLGSSLALVQTFDFKKHQVFCDLGGGPGTLCALAARFFPHLKIINFDLPLSESVCKEYLSQQRLENQVQFIPGDCLKDPFPPADLYAMGHLLHGWGDGKETHEVLSKCYHSLPVGGKLIVIESFIDDERYKNTFGLLMSLDMMIETPAGRNFTAPELQGWMQKAGFKNCHFQPLAGPHGMVVGEKKTH